MRTKRWQDWVTLIVGIWLFFSPWILGFYSEMPTASWNFFLVGAAFVVFAGFGLNLLSRWEEWVNLVLGIWMIISPWVLQYSGNTTPRDDAVIGGVIVAVMAIWAMADRNTHIGTHSRDHSLQP
jgi:hypothetical protein